MFQSHFMEYVVSASEAIQGNEVPVFAIVTVGDTIISESANQVEAYNRPWLHAEFLAIQSACDILDTRYLDAASLYVNLEPCHICASMLEKVRIKNIFFGAYDPKCGALVHNSRIFDHSLHKPNIIGGIQENRCSRILKNFFERLR